MPLDPHTLLRHASSGDTSALGQLLQSYTGYLTLLARVQIGRRVQGKVDSADVVQEAYLEAHRQFPRFRGTTEAEFLAWLRRILAGQLALALRRYLGVKGRDVHLERDIAGHLDQSSAALDGGLVASLSTPSQHASRRERAVLLALALDQLPPEHREVIVLRHLENLPFSVVAERLGRTENASRKLWARALAGLRRMLDGSSL